MQDADVVFGFEQQWQPFRDRHREFFGRYVNLQSTLNLAFIREVKDADVGDWLVFNFGRVCSEEFFEILLMAANGYGVCALKLIRSLYEHAVTMDYLSEHPNDVPAFINYHVVAQRKLMKSIQNSIKTEVFPGRRSKRLKLSSQRLRTTIW